VVAEVGGNQKREELKPKLGWLIGLRLFLAFVFLGTGAALELRAMSPFPLSPLYVLVGLTFFLSLIYLLLLNWVRSRWLLCHLQLSADLILATAFVHYTGGIGSAFSFLYLFIVLAAGILLSRRASLLFASLSSIFYGVLMDLEFYSLLPKAAVLPGLGRSAGYTLFQVVVHTAAFFLTAFLSSHLAERLREARLRLEKQSLDLRNLQTLYQDIIANIPSGITTFDLKGRIALFNQAAEQITGFPTEEVKEKAWQETCFAVFPGLGEFFTSPSSPFFLSTAVELIRKDGQAIPVGLSLSPLRDAEGRVRGLIAIFQDLSERRRTEEQLRQADRLAAAGRLAAGIAHEIRNPLASISGSIQLLKEELKLRGRNLKLLEIVLQEAERLKLITGQFLDFVRPKAACPKVCDLNTVLEETLALLEKSQNRHPETKLIHVQSPHPLPVLADPDQLKQVFWNICLNAFQAMPAGGNLTIATRVKGERFGVKDNGDGPDVVEVSFADTGGGTSPKELSRIFDPFYTTKDTGTGLGLSIAKKLVEDLGGIIEVENQPGEGMTFRLLLRQA